MPLGYDVLNRKLVINEAEAATVRHIFTRLNELGSATLLTHELVARGVGNKRGRLIAKGFLNKLFRNRVYIGEAVHKGTSYPGEREATVPRELWDQMHCHPAGEPAQPSGEAPQRHPCPAQWPDVRRCGRRNDATATRKGSRVYRYYTSMDAIRNRGEEGRDSFVRLNAGMVEGAVLAGHPQAAA